MYERCLPSIVYLVDIFQPTSLGQRRILCFSSMPLRRHHRQCPHPQRHLLRIVIAIVAITVAFTITFIIFIVAVIIASCVCHH
jgi:hypothetical protein